MVNAWVKAIRTVDVDFCQLLIYIILKVYIEDKAVAFVEHNIGRQTWTESNTYQSKRP
jgi:hypothetical protein